MKKFLICFFFATVLLGCRAPGIKLPNAIAECETGDLEFDKACYRDRYASAREVETKPVDKDKDADKEQPAEEQPVSMIAVPANRVVVPQTTNGGCIKGYNFGVVNHTNTYLEIAGPALRPCGRSYLVLQHVVQGNSGVRQAWLIPPMSVGHYYFDPDLGGDGVQDYSVIPYSPSHIHGSPTHPRRRVLQTYENQVVTPSSHTWQEVKIFPSDIGQLI